MAMEMFLAGWRDGRAAVVPSVALITMLLLVSGCVQIAPTATVPTFTATSAPAQAVRVPEPPPATVAPGPPPRPPTAAGTRRPVAPALPDPKTDPAAALRYSNFPAGLGNASYDLTHNIDAEPKADFENMGYGAETTHITGTLSVVDFLAGKIDWTMNLTQTLHSLGLNQELHLVRLGDRRGCAPRIGRGRGRSFLPQTFPRQRRITCFGAAGIPSTHLSRSIVSARPSGWRAQRSTASRPSGCT